MQTLNILVTIDTELAGISYHYVDHHFGEPYDKNHLYAIFDVKKKNILPNSLIGKLIFRILEHMLIAERLMIYIIVLSI